MCYVFGRPRLSILVYHWSMKQLQLRLSCTIVGLVERTWFLFNEHVSAGWQNLNWHKRRILQLKQNLVWFACSIIFSFIERAQFSCNEPVYRRDATPVPVYNPFTGERYSFLEFTLRENEQMWGKVPVSDQLCIPRIRISSIACGLFMMPAVVPKSCNKPDLGSIVPEISFQGLVLCSISVLFPQSDAP